MRKAIVIVTFFVVSGVALLGQTATMFNGNPAPEFRSEEGTARIIRVINPSGYPVLVFSAAHFHVIGQCYGSLYVSAGSVEFVGSGDHWAGVSLLGKPSETLSWSKDKKGRDCLLLRRGGQVDRLALAVTGAKGKLSAPIVLTGELSKLRTWFDDAVADFEATAYRFRKLTERGRLSGGGISQAPALHRNPAPVKNLGSTGFPSDDTPWYAFVGNKARAKV